MFIRVAKFHDAFGHPIGETPELPDQTVRNLRIDLIREELEEYCTAFVAEDRVEMADALADLLYVLAGTAVAYGVALDRQFESPYEDAEPLSGLSDDFAQALRDDFASYLHAETGDDLYEIKHAIYRMMIEIFLVARQSRIPINAVFDEVHRSNLSKLMPDGSVLYREDGKVMKGPNWQPPDIATILQIAA